MQLDHERVRRTHHESGFTLIELVVSVAILGVVSAALLGIVLQYAKTTVDTRSRLTESTDQQFISTYWQDDVSSLGRRSLDVATATFSTDQSVFIGPGGPGGCGSSAGSVVVSFAWNEFDVGTAPPANPWNSKPQQVAYVTVPNGSRLLLQRVRCSNGVEKPATTVAHNLTAAPTISCDTDTATTRCPPPTLPNRVSMTFTVQDAANANSPGYTTTVSADRRQG